MTHPGKRLLGMANLSQYSAPELRNKLQAAQARMRTLREKSGSTTERAVELAFAGAGIGASGYMQARNIEFLGVRGDGLLGGLALAAGMFGFGGKYSDELMTFGIGCASPFLSEMVRDQVR